MIAQPLEATDRAEDRYISPFLANLLSALATTLSGGVNFKESSVTTSCGRITISLLSENTIYVDGLYVEPDKQFTGCGSNILTALESVLSRLAGQTMRIKLWPVRSSVGFYLKNGYKLKIDTPATEEYYNQRKKLFGDQWEQYTAKIKARLAEKSDKIELEKLGDELEGVSIWTHEMLAPLFADSGFKTENPLFYSLWISDISGGDISCAFKIVQPSASGRLSSTV